MQKLLLFLLIALTLSCANKPSENQISIESKTEPTERVSVYEAEKAAAMSTVKTDTVLFNIPFNITNLEARTIIRKNSKFFKEVLGDGFQCYVRGVGFEYSDNGNVCFCIPLGDYSFRNVASVLIRDYEIKQIEGYPEMSRFYSDVMVAFNLEVEQLFRLKFEIFLLDENEDLIEIDELNVPDGYDSLKKLMIAFFKESYPQYYLKDLYGEKYVAFENNVKYILDYDDEDKEMSLSIENLTAWEDYKKKNDMLDGIEKDTIKVNPFK